MESMALNSAASMFKGAQETHADAVTSLIQGGTQAANAAMSAPDEGLRTSVMQSQGIGQRLNTVA